MAAVSSTLAAEFAHLKERAQSLFEGLRDLPPFGQKLWEPYFHRTFEVYNKLWKFQQERRPELEQQCGLQRHQIGETASRIGQLYYQFYLRKGDNCYLDEAYVFYAAIRSRHYFAIKTNAGSQSLTEAERHQLELRHMRFYARFAMVCLLTGRHGLLRELLGELRGLVRDFASKITESELQTWQLVQREFEAFLLVIKPLSIMRTDEGQPGNLLFLHGYRLFVDGQPSKDVARKTKTTVATYRSPLVLLGGYWAEHQVWHGEGLTSEGGSLRLRPYFVESHRTILASANLPSLRLAQAVLVCTVPGQLKVSEMPIDMYRISHALEWDSRDLKSANERGEPDRISNPVKYMVYRATFAQLALVLSTALSELDKSRALLLYMSADGWQPAELEESAPVEIRGGGVALATTNESAIAVRSCCLSPLDLRPFCRVPLFVIVESNNSQAFVSLREASTCFLLPLVCLMAPCCNSVASRHEQHMVSHYVQLGAGGALTLFLHDPLAGFCAFAGVKVTSTMTHIKCEELMLNCFNELVRLLVECSDTPSALLAFMDDAFTRTHLLRFILFHATFRLHKQAQKLMSESQLLPPRCEPPLPLAVSESDVALKMVRQLAASFGAVDEFNSQWVPAPGEALGYASS